MFPFTLPSTGGLRNVIRVRLPAVSFRIIRFIGTSTADCQIWNTSRMEYKVLPTGKGYAVNSFNLDIISHRWNDDFRDARLPQFGSLFTLMREQGAFVLS